LEAKPCRGVESDPNCLIGLSTIKGLVACAISTILNQINNLIQRNASFIASELFRSSVPLFSQFFVTDNNNYNNNNKIMFGMALTQTV